jgi:hypothetical protein
VVALGTHDFSTALHSGEPWPTADSLNAAYKNAYQGARSRMRNLNGDPRT